jgi:hypothetical protein
MKNSGFALVLLIILLAMVGIAGVYYFNTQNKTITPKSEEAATAIVLSPPLPSPTSISSSVEPIYNYTGWQTYTDSRAGFSIQYPPDSKVNDKQEGKYVYFTNFRITVHGNYDGGSRREWLNSKYDLSTYKVTTEEISVAGLNVLIVKVSDPGSMGSTFVVIPNGSTVYLFSKDSGQESLDEVKKIVSSFKLL